MRGKRVWAGIAIVVGLAAISVIVGNAVYAGPKVHVGRTCGEPNRPSLDQVDHAGFDALLGKHVDDQGMVSYAAWKASAADMQALDDYLARLGCVDLSKQTSEKGKLVFWINAYNAVTIKGILREYPTTSIRKHTAKLGYNIWKDLLLIVDGKGYSLDDMEHSILRKMGEPRIHFAIVCASKGCPPLLNQAYTAAKLDEQLASNARKFFAQPINLQVDGARRNVGISSLIKWYGSDFAPSTQAQIQQLKPYFPNADQLGWIDQGGLTYRYLDYDWTLNEKR